MAHRAADGSMWTNAAQAKRVPGRSIGDGKQPVAKFSKPEAPRQPTAEPVSGGKATPDTVDAGHDQPSVEVTQDGDMYTVTAKFASAEEAHAAAQALQGADQQDMAPSNPSQAMM